MTYDPLSSHGLTLALKTGCDAALAVKAQLDGERDSLAGYAATLDRYHAQYTVMRRAYYRQEKRWPGSIYWQRRHSP